MTSPTAGLPSADMQLRLLLGMATDYATYVVDPSGTVLQWSSGAERITGFAPDSVLAQNFAILFTDDDQADGRPERLLELLHAKGHVEGGGWCVRHEGRNRWTSYVAEAIRSAAGVVTGFAFVLHDLTNHQSTHDVFDQDNHGLLRLLMESVVDHAIYMIDRNGIVVSWNPGAARIKGYDQSEIIGQNFDRFFTTEDRKAGKPERILRSALVVGRYEEDGWRVRKDGTRFWASIVLDAVRDPAGEIVGFAKVTRDITQKLALQAAQEQLHQAQKMESIGQLTGGIAHDFNNLLSAVTGSLDLISANLNDELMVRRLLATAQNAAGRGAKLTTQLLTFAREQSLQPRATDANGLVIEVETLLRGAAGDAIELRLDLGPQLWSCNIDPAQFQSALLNLVINARDAMPKGGTLTITTQNVSLSPKAAADLTGIEDGPYVTVAVGNSGDDSHAGGFDDELAPETTTRSTEPFRSNKDIANGPGAGMSQVYGFVRQSNGQVKIEGHSRGGTLVSLYLPRSADMPETASPSQQADNATLGTVLVVEDDRDVLDIATAAIRSFGYKVHFADDAYEALNMLHRYADIDILFTDVVMPQGMSGIELAYQACMLKPHLQVLLASGYPREALPGHDELKDGVGFIAKPYALDDLSDQLAALLDEQTKSSANV